MSTSVATANTNTAQSKPRRDGRERGQGSGRRRGSGPTQRKSQNDPAPTESTITADTPATPTITAPTAVNSAVVADNPDSASQDDDTGMCSICMEPMTTQYYSISECNHKTCHICALRLRALWKNQNCSFCKEPQHSLIFTTSPNAKFASFTPKDIPYKDSKLSIFFETQEMMEESLILLRFNCPDGSCDYIGSGWEDLKLHVRAIHGHLMCGLCIKMKKIFAHEQATYPPNLLSHHLPSIKVRGQPEITEGNDMEVHPMCEFCRECFLGDDELYEHMRQKHEECFVCKRLGVQHKYYKNYEALETHFMKEHYPCKLRACLDQKFVVFGTEMDLKGHMVEVHGAEMSSRDRRDVRRLETDFDYGGRGGNRRRGGGVNRDRDRDRDPPPQRQPPNVRRRELGTGLTADAPVPSSSTPPPPVTIPAPPPDTDTPTSERYNALYSKVASTAANPSRAVGAVELSLRSYRNSESTARDLISSIWNVMGQSTDTSATFINLIVDLLDEEDKKNDLLRAWNGFKIEQRGLFPDLVPTSTGTEYAGIAGGRVLNAKHQTSRSSRSRRQVLDRVAAAASSSNWQRPQPANHFPALASTSQSPPLPKSTPAPSRSQKKNTTPWTSNGQNSSSGFRPQVQQPVSQSRSQQSRTAAPPLLSKSAFPELPTIASSKPPKGFISGNKSLKNILGDAAPVQPAWGQGPSTQPSSPPPDPEPEPATTKGRKGKGKQKQTLFTLGSIPS